MFEENSKSVNTLLQEAFAGKIVRKDLTKKIKEGANVPVYVLEYLLGMYCATDDEASIEEGVQRVKDILADNFVRPDEAEKIKSKIREMGSYTVIDKVEANLTHTAIHTGRFFPISILKTSSWQIFISNNMKNCYPGVFGASCA